MLFVWLTSIANPRASPPDRWSSVDTEQTRALTVASRLTLAAAASTTWTPRRKASITLQSMHTLHSTNVVMLHHGKKLVLLEFKMFEEPLI